MTLAPKAEVVSAAEAVLAAARELPEDPIAASKADVITALKRYDVAENLLDDAIDAYIRQAPKGKGT